jgi:hypothetical protein
VPSWGHQYLKQATYYVFSIYKLSSREERAVKSAASLYQTN